MPLGDKIALWLFMRNVVYMEFVAVRLLPHWCITDFSRSSTEVRNHAESQSMMMLQSIVLREWGS